MSSIVATTVYEENFSLKIVVENIQNTKHFYTCTTCIYISKNVYSLKFPRTLPHCSRHEHFNSISESQPLYFRFNLAYTYNLQYFSGIKYVEKFYKNLKRTVSTLYLIYVHRQICGKIRMCILDVCVCVYALSIHYSILIFENVFQEFDINWDFFLMLLKILHRFPFTNNFGTYYYIFQLYQ